MAIAAWCSGASLHSLTDSMPVVDDFFAAFSRLSTQPVRGKIERGLEAAAFWERQRGNVQRLVDQYCHKKQVLVRLTSLELFGKSSVLLNTSLDLLAIAVVVALLDLRVGLLWLLALAGLHQALWGTTTLPGMQVSAVAGALVAASGLLTAS
eukprot:Unigene3545_Nuclearia_a/m.10821 Unigene3545_Nuclearia_a/g.10821  ORF Unigene3545_Nuclearia_a/g.10821 Unigene3545_Nuclearia_a/m.10821 type:complete len:152 (-) Unigene3545_Nuclearia_a:165-620(-)